MNSWIWTNTRGQSLVSILWTAISLLRQIMGILLCLTTATWTASQCHIASLSDSCPLHNVILKKAMDKKLYCFHFPFYSQIILLCTCFMHNISLGNVQRFCLFRTYLGNDQGDSWWKPSVVSRSRKPWWVCYGHRSFDSHEGKPLPLVHASLSQSRNSKTIAFLPSGCCSCTFSEPLLAHFTIYILFMVGNPFATLLYLFNSKDTSVHREPFWHTTIYTCKITHSGKLLYIHVKSQFVN